MKTQLLTKLQASQIIAAAFSTNEAPGEWKRMLSLGVRVANIGRSQLTKVPHYTLGESTWRLQGDVDDVEYWMGFTFDPSVSVG